MHSRVIASRAQGPRRVLPWLVVLLAHLVPSAAASPYLTRIGPPPLRHRERLQPAPIVPVAAQAAAETLEHSGQPGQNLSTAIEPTPVQVQPETSAAESAPQALVAPVTAPITTPPPPILQDPLRERVQLDDFLPFFTPPAPAQPASRATYRRE